MTITPTLFALHDGETLQLPADIIRLRDARDRAAEHLRELTAPTHFLDATVEAFITGSPLPDVAPVLDAEREARAFEHRLEVGRNTAETLDRRIVAAITEHADSFITDVLRPVFDATVAKLRDAYTLLEPFEGASRGALALANAKVRQAAGTADTATGTYTTLRTASAEVRRLLPAPQYDTDGEFASFTDIHAVWPRERRTNFGAVPAPWENAPDPLAWQVRNLTPWLPTVAEQDEQWLKVYGEALKAEQVRAEKSRAMAATFGA